MQCQRKMSEDGCKKFLSNFARDVRENALGGVYVYISSRKDTFSSRESFFWERIALRENHSRGTVEYHWYTIEYFHREHHDKSVCGSVSHLEKWISHLVQPIVTYTNVNATISTVRCEGGAPVRSSRNSREINESRRLRFRTVRIRFTRL